MDLLARREHSRLELERKLDTRGFGQPLIAATLDQLEADGLLSATRFARSFVASRYARGQGPVRIRRDLAERGIEQAGEWLDADEYDWAALARQTRERRFGTELPSAYREKARQMRFLEYRGFTHEQIRRALEFADD